MPSSYTVHTQHGAKRTVQTTTFNTYESALDFANSNTPDTDCTMVPNVDDDYSDRPNYEQGMFWDRCNRYAVITKDLGPA